jgi:hypothetical protein
MSRVIYTNVADTAEQERLRETHRVRVVADTEEGTGVDKLPGGVYGFTYSPGLLNAPLFAVRRYRSYEIHKLSAGETFIVAFADSETASRIGLRTIEGNVLVRPDPDSTADTLVKIPYSRIRHHRQYAAPNQEGFTVTLG